MLRRLFNDRKLVYLLIIAVIIRLFALQSSWVETVYSSGVYPYISRSLRILFGWIPFSIGDLIYIAAALFLLIKLWKLFTLIKRRQLNSSLTTRTAGKYLKIVLLVYISFSLLWGLNYFREGIEKQLAIKQEEYTVQELFDLTLVLQQRLNTYAEQVDTVQRQQYLKNKQLFQLGVEAYNSARQQYPFLAFPVPSMKSSTFSVIGHYFGFTGYYNPFTAEAQLNTTVPVFLRPFIVAHEIAHQLGYAKENEASFVAYLASRNYNNVDFKYSIYFDLYSDAIFQCLRSGNRELVTQIRKNLHPRVKRDNAEVRRYLTRNRNFIEPFISGVYDNYLKLNNQPKGKATYNEVIAFMVAFMRKYGKESI